MSVDSCNDDSQNTLGIAKTLPAWNFWKKARFVGRKPNFVWKFFSLGNFMPTLWKQSRV